MSLINKGTLPTQLQTVLDGLNLPSERLTRLTTLLKTAINAGADGNALAAQIQSYVESGSRTSLDDVTLLALASNLVSPDMSLTVPTLGDLTDPNIAPGSVFTVLSNNLPYVKKSDGTWALIDPSLQPVPVENAYAWGNNTVGQLGTNNTTSYSSPVSVVGGYTDWVQISAGGGLSAAIRANGTAWCWGSNVLGGLGDNTTTSRLSPVSVVGGFTDWVQISAGANHTAAVRANGTAWGWGQNTYGRLGDNTTTHRSSPVSVVGGFTDWVQISTSLRDHSAAIRANGTAWCWGNNTQGKLGDSTTVNKSSPVSVVGGFTDWLQISPGFFHTVAVRANGTAWAWGSNGNGQLGDNTVTARSSPVSVVGGFTDWVQISAGSAHTAAIRANGTAWAWGSNGNGRLGDNTITDRSSPVSVVGGFTDWVQISAGSAHTAAIRANGTAWAWGSNISFNSALGDNTTTDRSSPVSVVGGFTDWVQISAGSGITVALRGSN